MSKKKTSAKALLAVKTNIKAGVREEAEKRG
jgi:hypothetical protein